VRRQHSAAGQLGVALQLCGLRWLGFIPEDLTAAAPEAITTLASLLDVPARSIFDYSVRPQTRREHRPLVREHAGFAAAGDRSLEPVRGWLIERALEHARPSLLFAELCGELRRRRIERPAVAEAMRLVAWARERAHEQTFQRLAPQLTDAVRAQLDGLLSQATKPRAPVRRQRREIEPADAELAEQEGTLVELAPQRPGRSRSSAASAATRGRTARHR
jgi:Domain of unknown function (DUF4158)